MEVAEGGHLLPGPLRTLDAGCGSGAFTMYASRIGNEAVGVDINDEDIRKAEVRARLLGLSDVEFVRGDLQNLGEVTDALGQFDQVICMEVIEHIEDDRRVVADLASLLRPGGRLLITTPSQDRRGLLGRRLSEHEHGGGHVRSGYSHDELRELCEGCGLDVVSQDYISGFISQHLTYLMRAMRRVSLPVAWAVTFPLRIAQVFDPMVTRLIRYPHLSLGVCAIRRG